MKGNEQLIADLNNRLAEELTAINQYMVHSEMCELWHYEKLHKAIEKQAMEEMRHAEWLIERILFLEGTPTVSKLNQIQIGKNASEMIANDLAAEQGAVRGYNETIALAGKVGDEATGDFLTKILVMEEVHVNWGEAQLTQIQQVGLENYLANQSAETAK